MDCNQNSPIFIIVVCPNHNLALQFGLNLLQGGDIGNVSVFLQLSQFGVDGINMSAQCCGLRLLQFYCLLKIFNVLGHGFLQECKFSLEIGL